MIRFLTYSRINALLLLVILLFVVVGCAENNSVPLQLERGIQRAIATVSSSIVTIECSCDSPKCMNSAPCQGAGIVLDKDGYIATTADYILNTSDLKIYFQDGCSMPAKLIGKDEETNIALLGTDKHMCGCYPIKYDLDNRISAGSLGLLVNNTSVSKGVSAGLGVMANSWLGGDDNWSQPLYLMQAGDILTMRGAPVVTMGGNTLGICDAMIEAHNGSWTIIPIETILRITRELKQSGKIHRGWIGLQCSVEDLELTPSSRVESHIKVDKVLDGSPAHIAGVKSGDIVVGLNSDPIHDLTRLRSAVTGSKAGNNLSLDISRGPTERLTLQVTTSELPMIEGRQRLCNTRSL